MSGVWSVGCLLEAQQFGEQDRFVTAWASTSQTLGMTKQPALCTTSVTERAFPARRALVQGMGGQRPSALKVSAEFIDVDVRKPLMAEAKRTLLARLFTVPSARSGQRPLAYRAAIQLSRH